MFVRCSLAFPPAPQLKLQPTPEPHLHRSPELHPRPYLQGLLSPIPEPHPRRYQVTGTRPEEIPLLVHPLCQPLHSLHRATLGWLGYNACTHTTMTVFITLPYKRCNFLFVVNWVCIVKQVSSLSSYDIN